MSDFAVAEHPVADDPFSEQHLIESLPLDIQGELREYGGLEKINTAAELHDLLLRIRRDFTIPPWHPFTYLIRWHANACEGNSSKPEGMWHNSKFLSTHIYDLHAEIGTQTWVYMAVHIWRGDEEPVTFNLCVRPDEDDNKAVIWNLATEYPISGDLMKVFGRGRPTMSAPRRVVNRAAMVSLQKGELECSINHYIKQRKRSKQRGLHQYKELIAEAAIPEIEQPIQQAINTEFIPMFEMACIKARELGMEETIKRWKQLIGLT